MGSSGTIMNFSGWQQQKGGLVRRREVTLFIGLKETCQWKFVVFNFVFVLQVATFSAVHGDCRTRSFIGDCNFRFLVLPTNRRKRVFFISLIYTRWQKLSLPRP